MNKTVKNSMQRLISYLLMVITAVAGCSAMDFGLRFQANEWPLGKRTSLTVGDKQFGFKKNFKVGFFFNFYSGIMFGDLCTITTDDGNHFSVVSSYMNDGTYKLGITINDDLHVLNDVTLKLNPGKEDHIDFQIDKTNNRVTLYYNDNDLSVPFDLSKAKSATFLFGRHKNLDRNDVAPIDLRNIRLFIDGENTNHWDLKYHDSPDSSVDLLGGVAASVVNPHWLIDDHSDWKPLYSNEFKENIQTAFDAKKETFYIVSDSKVITFDPLTGETSESPVNGGRRVMVYSNHLAHDSVSDNLINYNLTQGKLAKFDFSSMTWNTNVEGKDEETRHFNHAFAINGDHIYTFGGYGFYTFNNDLFKINIKTRNFEALELKPEIMPLTSASMAIVDNVLYIFGGKGNTSGKQELPSHYAYTMYAYDLNTLKGGPLWQLDSVPENFLPTQSMFFNRQEDSFYLGSTAHGGELIRISRTKPEWNIASTPIKSTLDVHDFVFDLYRSKDEKRLYLVLDKRLDEKTHDYNIYTISAPFLSDEEIIKSKTINSSGADGDSSASSSKYLWYILAAIGVIIVAFIIWNVLKRKKRLSNANSVFTVAAQQEKDVETETPEKSVAEKSMSALPSESGHVSESENEYIPQEEPEKMSQEEQEEISYQFDISGISNNMPSHFDRSKSSVSLFGAFCIRDKEGNDITSKFTSRLKNLFIMLLLSCQKNSSGIKYQTIDEEIWNDKDEKAAQNNRNVSMRKLRLLLEEVGDIPIVYDKGFFKIDMSHVMFDYGELHGRISSIEEGETPSPEMVDEILELLLMGPLLPKTRYEWLDKYKAEFSDSALTILNKFLKYEIEHDGVKAYRIAETISLHDPLSEEAMIAKCQILSKRKMYGLAKNIYHKFCAEYERSLGEQFKMSFSDVCKMKI